MLEVEPKTVLISIGNCALQTETSQLRYDSTGNLKTLLYFVSWPLCVSNPHRNSKSTLLRIYTTKTSIIYCIFSESIPPRQAIISKHPVALIFNQPTNASTHNLNLSIIMKFTVAALLALSATTTSAFQPLSVPRYTTTTTSALFQSTTTETAETEETRNNSKKDDRLRMMKSGQFHRRGFKEVREEVETRMEGEYQSSLVKDMRGNQYTMEKDGVKVYLAKVCSGRMMYSWWFRPSGFVWIMYLCRTQTWIFMLIFLFFSFLRTLDSAGVSNDPLPWPTKPSITFRIAKFTLPTNSFTILKSMINCIPWMSNSLKRWMAEPKTLTRSRKEMSSSCPPLEHRTKKWITLTRRWVEVGASFVV